MSNIAQIGAAGLNAAGTIAVTKIAADTMHRTTKGMGKHKRTAKKAKSNGKIYKPKTYAGLGKKGKLSLTRHL